MESIEELQKKKNFKLYKVDDNGNPLKYSYEKEEETVIDTGVI